ncbi:glioma tumor suppressor candidate region gene 1 protein [Austrofundulus limnaeus]|uniref:Glioma tumor suppressor candidate region gene 1 protein n=1 Tax=Austrofundulus limnaeus TaxID=52670 RepID=A0A2I4AMT3_AUSLI|nr:PREDICTED: glioma tumor suppressor candidate region gene 1 protein-like [Austrofundulus limnaeus]
MEDEDGTCLLDVLCDPQALNDFLHGTNELHTDLLINVSSGEPSLFTDAPVSVWIHSLQRLPTGEYLLFPLSWRDPRLVVALGFI